MTSSSDEPRFQDYPLFVRDVSKLLGYHPQYVRYLAKKGSIPGVKICGQWRFSEAELRAHLISFENSPAVKVKGNPDLLS